MKPTLYILAAGMGSRYGGLKQLDGLGPQGETIMDYSVYDALRAGFGKIVFVIRHDFEQEFREKVVKKYEGMVPVEVVFQDIKDIPAGYETDPERTKPWGTGHAVLCGKKAINEPFAVINADDYYGAESFKILADSLRESEGKKGHYCMVGFKIENTLSENGGVSRGLCQVSPEGYLTGVTECHNIRKENGKLLQTLADGSDASFPEGASVSMNMWGFTPDFFDYSEDAFREFLAARSKELKSEFYIPTVVNDLIERGEVRLKVEQTPSKWFGVTFAADRPDTVEHFRKLTEEGVYPEGLFRDRILVTGGTGYIGSHTTVELQKAGYDVVIVDNLSNSDRKVLDGIERITGKRPAFIEGDITDKETLRKVFETHPGIRGIINFAASKAVGESVEKPLLYYRNNLVSLINILELMPEYGVKGLVFSSSCTVYGEPDKNPIDESAPIKAATSPYGNTKQICEEIITDTIHSGAPIKSILLRYFNPIGAHPSAEIGELPNGVPANLVPFLTQTAAGIRKELTVFGDDYNTPDGSCIRDYIDVNDLARAHVAAIRRMLADENAANPEIFNLGTGRGFSVLELIHSFERATGVDVPYRIGARREGDIEQIWANPEKANTVLGWKAETPIDETMRNAWAWQKRLH